MTAKRSYNTGQGKKQYAFILLPVVLTLTILAAIAFLLSQQSAINSGNVNRQQQHDAALYIAKAGLSHALWKINRQNCTGYTDIPTTAMGNHQYLASYTDATGTTLANGSPANITVVGTHANGASYSITRNREKVYQYPSNSVALQLGSDPGKDAAILGSFLLRGKNFGIYKQRVKTNIISPARQLIQFDISSLPAEAIIISAELQLNQSVSITANAGARIDVHRITQSWVEGTKTGSGTADGVTWDTYDGSLGWTAGSGGSYDPAITASTVITTDNIVRHWDMTSLVQGWHKGQFANEGMLLKGSGSLNVSFSSKEDGEPANRPKLLINFACECGAVCNSVASAPAKKIYWTDDAANKIQRSDEDGSNVEDVIVWLDSPAGLDIDTVNGKLYWSNGMQIKRADIDGSNPELLYTGAVNTLDIKLDVGAGKMYWTHDNGANLVMRADLDGANSEVINNSLDQPAYITLDISAGHIYLTSYGSGNVMRMNLDGSNLIKLIDGSTGPKGNAIDLVNGKIYWTGGASYDWIKQADLDGSNKNTIVTGLNSPQDIVYDADNDRIYWVDATNQLIQRSDADGSNIENIISTGLTSPKGIVIVNADDVKDPASIVCNGNFVDNFDSISFKNNDGSLAWATIWQEVGESDGPGSGDIRVMNDKTNYQLRFRDNDNGGEGVIREANLTGAVKAQLNFNYRRTGLDNADDYLSVEISSTGIAGPWVERGKLAGPANDASYLPWTYNLDPSEVTANTAIRFRTASTMGGSDQVYLDDIELKCSP